MDHHDKPPTIERMGKIGEFRVSCNSMLDADTTPHRCTWSVVVTGQQEASDAAGEHGLRHVAGRAAPR
jgi:hypothetical protein